MEKENSSWSEKNYRQKRNEASNEKNHFNKSNSGRDGNGSTSHSDGYHNSAKTQKKYENGRDSKQYYKKRPQNNGGYGAFQKDMDEDEYEHKKFESKKRNFSSNKDKIKDLQPDKMDITKRFEKEKKVMQKKKQDKKNHQQSRPQTRVKRSNNVDWTREYENDSYDDDDMSYYY